MLISYKRLVVAVVAVSFCLAGGFAKAQSGEFRVG